MFKWSALVICGWSACVTLLPIERVSAELLIQRPVCTYIITHDQPTHPYAPIQNVHRWNMNAANLKYNYTSVLIDATSTVGGVFVTIIPAHAHTVSDSPKLHTSIRKTFIRIVIKPSSICNCVPIIIYTSISCGLACIRPHRVHVLPSCVCVCAHAPSKHTYVAFSNLTKQNRSNKMKYVNVIEGK